MIRRLAYLKGFALASFFIVASSCSSDQGFAPDLPIVGNWVATTFKLTPDGDVESDVLAKGGSLALVIAADNTTSGSMVIPASLTGGTVFTFNLAGTVARVGNNVTLHLTTDSFAGHLIWNVYPTELFATPQHIVEGATVLISLTRH